MIKFGLELFSQTQISKMVIWVLLNIIVSVSGVFISMKIYKWKHTKSQEIGISKEISSDEKVQQYLSDNELELSFSKTDKKDQ